jgi:hypothetical protein
MEPPGTAVRTAVSQPAPDRQGRSYRFSFDQGMRSLSGHAAIVAEPSHHATSHHCARLWSPNRQDLGPHGDRNEALEQRLPWPTWAFVLRDLGMGTTRLIVRMRSEFKPTLVGLLANNYGLEPMHLLMERKLLLDSKHRAEPTPAS